MYCTWQRVDLRRVNRRRNRVRVGLNVRPLEPFFFTFGHEKWAPFVRLRARNPHQRRRRLARLNLPQISRAILLSCAPDDGRSNAATNHVGWRCSPRAATCLQPAADASLEEEIAQTRFGRWPGAHRDSYMYMCINLSICAAPLTRF